MKGHFFGFIKKFLKQSHAEVTPPLKDFVACWYLPLFWVYYPMKPGQLSVVFKLQAAIIIVGLLMTHS